MAKVHVISFIEDDRPVISVFDNPVAASKFHSFCEYTQKRSLEYDIAPVLSDFKWTKEEEDESV